MAPAQDCDMQIADTAEYLALESQLANAARVAEPACTELRIVVHVIYDGTAVDPYRGEISQGQVLSQIRFANMFLRNDSLAYNPDHTALGYTMALATTDPDGMPTTGINYVDGSELFGTAFSQYGIRTSNYPNGITASTIGNSLQWGVDMNGKRYLNCYISPRINQSISGGVQAFAYFPTTSVVMGNYNMANTFGASQLEDEYDGDFDLKSYTDLGYTWVHELGHNFALFHNFQGQSCTETNCALQGDRVCDTPPIVQYPSCLIPNPCGPISHNVMDYIGQQCKDRFTQGQMDRSALAIQNSLSAYLVCNACDKTPDFNGDGAINIMDFTAFAGTYGTVESDAAFNELYDMNCDGAITISDFTAFANSFGAMVGNTISLSPREIRQVDAPMWDITGKRANPRNMKTGIYIMKAGETYTRILINGKD